MVNNHRIVRVALMAAVLCVVAPIALPVGAVPITLSTLGLYFIVGLLSIGESTVAVLLYVLLGGIGLPVFAGFLGGVERLLGPTGGFIWGYIPCCLIAGLLLRKGRSRWRLALAFSVGTAVLYATGTLWYMLQANCGLWAAMAVCVVPFLPADALKIAVACGVLPPLRQRLQRFL